MKCSKPRQNGTGKSPSRFDVGGMLVNFWSASIVCRHQTIIPSQQTIAQQSSVGSATTASRCGGVEAPGATTADDCGRRYVRTRLRRSERRTHRQRNGRSFEELTESHRRTYAVLQRCSSVKRRICVLRCTYSMYDVPSRIARLGPGACSLAVNPHFRG